MACAYLLPARHRRASIMHTCLPRYLGTTKTTQTLQPDAKSSTFVNARPMRRVRSLSTIAASCRRLAASYLTIISNQTQSYLSSQKCVLAAPATAWRRHVDDTAQMHATRVPQRVRGYKTIRGMGLRVLRPFWLHLIISPAEGRFKAATHPCRAIVAERIRCTL